MTAASNELQRKPATVLDLDHISYDQNAKKLELRAQILAPGEIEPRTVTMELTVNLEDVLRALVYHDGCRKISIKDGQVRIRGFWPGHTIMVPSVELDMELKNGKIIWAHRPR